jgi:hypothetical protein
VMGDRITRLPWMSEATKHQLAYFVPDLVQTT